MNSEWISQSRACTTYGLSVNDLRDNTSHVIDQSVRPEGAQNEASSSVKLAKYPRVPLTVLLVKNPRGYRLPMRLYKTSELEKLSALKKAETPPPNPQKKVLKKAAPNRKRTKPVTPRDPPCLTNGHNIVSDQNGKQSCTVCGSNIEIEEI
ncbi:hypothetical protein BgAZ_404280 [Babesia gibsoni]|uniref:Uncharacterized protein n=1 Tax=Babesia gibsoni TaxID=33632 RepID=A0AAD8PCS7_BABGI|nr:hypothetical protein BgAZ_404280 [Babesia gibsoni]